MESKLWKANRGKCNGRNKDNDNKSTTRKKQRDDSRQSYEDRWSDQKFDSSTQRGTKFDKYTSTNVPIAEILAPVEDNDFEGLLWPPGKIRRPSNKRDKNKYCLFHKDHDHKYFKYFDLKDQI